MSRFNPSRQALPRIEVYTGIIRGQTTGSTSNGPASTMSFKVWVNFPDGPQEISGLKFVSQQWPDEVCDVVPMTVGTVVLIASVAGQLQMTGTMLPFVEECGGSE